MAARIELEVERLGRDVRALRLVLLGIKRDESSP